MNWERRPNFRYPGPDSAGLVWWMSRVTLLKPVDQPCCIGEIRIWPVVFKDVGQFLPSRPSFLLEAHAQPQLKVSGWQRFCFQICTGRSTGVYGKCSYLKGEYSCQHLADSKCVLFVCKMLLNPSCLLDCLCIHWLVICLSLGLILPSSKWPQTPVASGGCWGHSASYKSWHEVMGGWNLIWLGSLVLGLHPLWSTGVLWVCAGSGSRGGNLPGVQGRHKAYTPLERGPQPS